MEWHGRTRFISALLSVVVDHGAAYPALSSSRDGNTEVCLQRFSCLIKELYGA
jgi:hypothetical protein